VICFIVTENIDEPSEYYDINKINKLKDKLSLEVGNILHKFLKNVIKVS